jgi:pSer/pThr/pTyr-binding forkhead associated (FHA) protein/tetratricopeptide (TPR) repeat protein
MPTLIIRGADGSETCAELSGELTVGREAGNDLVVADKGVSRQHCRFFLDEQGTAFVEDLGSANGVYVDGQRIEQATELRPEAEVQIGGATARLEERRGSKGPRPSAALARRPKPQAPERAGAAKLAKPQAGGKVAPSQALKGRAVKPAPVPKAKGKDCLEGQGAFSGVRFDLAGAETKAKALVGRVAPADIAIDDDSVSRKHAEIVRSKKGVLVRDLGSANGTFLNGERVTEAPLSPGDVLRFGVVELRYTGVAAPPADPARRRKLLMVAAGAGVLSVLGIVFYLAEHGGEGAPNFAALGPTSPGPEPTPPKDPMRELSRCKALADPESDQLDWRKAVEVCGRVLKLDQTLTEARELELRAKHEVEYEELLKDAKIKLSTSREEMALGSLVKIPTSSTSFNQARLAFKEASERLFKRSLSACKTDLAAGFNSSAADKCQKAIDVTCNRAGGADAEAKKLYDQAARAAGGRPQAACPPEYKVFEPKVPEPTPEDAERMIASKYPDAPIQEPMLKYFQVGKPRQIADEFKRLRAKTGRRYPQLDDFIVQLELIDGRYASGQEGLRRNQPELAWEFWKDAFDADAKLMPIGVRSFMIREMSSQLAALDYRLGYELQRIGRYREASKYIFDGYKFDKTNTDIILLIANWEVAAKRMMDAQPDCDSAQTALEVTLPESSVHKKAEQLRQERGCP